MPTSVGGQGLAIEIAALDHEERVRLGEVTQCLRDGDRVTVHEGDRGRTDEVVVERRDAGVVRRDLGQRVLHHGVARVLTDGLAQRLELGNSEAAVFGQQNGGRALEQVREFGNRGFLVRHGHSLCLQRAPRERCTASERWKSECRAKEKAPAQLRGARPDCSESLRHTCAGPCFRKTSVDSTAASTRGARQPAVFGSVQG